MKIRNGTKINYIEVKNVANTCRYNIFLTVKLFQI